MGMPLKTVATSFKPNGNPQNEEIHGDEVGNYEVAQFFFFILCSSKFQPYFCVFRIFHSSQAHCHRVTGLQRLRGGSQHQRAKLGHIQASACQLLESTTTTQDRPQYGRQPGNPCPLGLPSDPNQELPTLITICSSQQLQNHSRAAFLTTLLQQDPTSTSTV